MSDNDSSALLGRTIAGKFIVEAVIGFGGSGTVYRARQVALDRTVALKVLRDDVARDPHFVERFKREARAASRLDHPNSVRVLDFGAHDDSLLYLAMEHVVGRTLYEVILEDGPLPDSRIVDILSQVLSAVGVAHDLEVVHRDLKPDNIIIIRAKGDGDDDGGSAELAKVCDFGIATLGTVVRDGVGMQVGGPLVTSHGLLIGTPAYMSPEQAKGELADRRSDLYSAGVVLYHMLAGRVPFEGENASVVVMKHITELPQPPSRFARVNPALEAICMKAMNKAPQDRFASAREMRVALRASIASSATTMFGFPPHRGGAGSDTRAAAGAHPTAVLLRRRRLVLVAGALLVAVLAGGLLARPLLRREGVSPAQSAGAVAWPAREPSVPPSPMSPVTLVPSASEKHAEAETDKGTIRPVRRRPPRREASRSPPPPAAIEVPAAPVAAPPPAAIEAPAAPVAAPPPPPPRPPPPPPRAIPPAPRVADIERARVSVTAVNTASGIPGSSIRAAMSRIPVLACYRDALRARGTEATGTAMLHLRTDAAGYVTEAVLDNAQFLPSMKTCVEKAARTVRVKDVDTGEATVDVTLRFMSAP